MPKCITCGAEADWNPPYGDLCKWCAKELTGIIVDLARGTRTSYTIPPNIGNNHPGIWTKDNWMTYPDLVTRRAQIGSIDSIRELIVLIKTIEDKYPHKCPKCNSPAYIGFSIIECSKGCK